MPLSAKLIAKINFQCDCWAITLANSINGECRSCKYLASMALRAVSVAASTTSVWDVAKKSWYGAAIASCVWLSNRATTDVLEVDKDAVEAYVTSIRGLCVMNCTKLTLTKEVITTNAIVSCMYDSRKRPCPHTASLLVARPSVCNTAFARPKNILCSKRPIVRLKICGPGTGVFAKDAFCFDSVKTCI